MSRTTARIATIALLLAGLTSPVMADPVAAPAAQAPASRQPATAEVRAAYDRADALSRQIFWTDQFEIDPMDPIAGVKAAQALRELSRFDQAAEMAGKVLMVQPANVEAMLEAGRAHIARGQAFYGIASLENARDARPGDWRVWSLLGTAYEQVRRPDDARSAWAQALVISPDNPAVLTNIAIAAMTQGDIAVAEPLLRRAAAQPGASLKVRLNLAMVLGLTGNMAEAEQMLRRDLPPEAADRNLEWLRARIGGGAVDQARTWGSLQGG
ncbi:tetratricopeptide repeat protein [Brevundimonas sp.]|uniref:tetratricopeptide repeat protein n=1 Tax=Brevundimonas sp. TaxID=1871086 RepID=UPI002ABA479B|nr:tetratricopeptide repeat protein [Brevundimonas sp.]MDZ4362707.1 tetratricopeptide repeat protein [Brevundimonas sp.]